VIVCVAGSISFHVEGGDMELRPGDRIDLPAGVEHAATVGPDGVECLEGTS
jgi:quercetin dioxygenase-like cupin family protein